MIDCDNVHPRLGLLLDGELTVDESASLREHMDGCTACAGIYAEYMALRSAIAAPLPSPFPGGEWGWGREVWESIRSQIDQPALIDQLRQMREELRMLRAEMAQLRRELGTPPVRANSLSVPDAPNRPLPQYRLV